MVGVPFGLPLHLPEKGYPHQKHTHTHLGQAAPWLGNVDGHGPSSETNLDVCGETHTGSLSCS